VIDLDPAGNDREQMALLERPRKLAERRPGQPPREDVLEGGALSRIGALVEVQHPAPR